MTGCYRVRSAGRVGAAAIDALPKLTKVDIRKLGNDIGDFNFPQVSQRGGKVWLSG